MNEFSQQGNMPKKPHSDNYTWHKSSKSYSAGQCVEVALANEYVLVRDSKNIAGPKLTIGTEAWNLFIENIKDGKIS